MAKEITDETWTTRCNLITEYLNNNDVGGASAGLQWAMDAGKADKTIRPTLWQTIYSTCKLLPNNPLGGIRSTLPADVLTVIKALQQRVYDAYMTMAPSEPLCGSIYSRRGQYSPMFGDAETQATYEAGIAYDNLVAMYKAYVKKDASHKQWNGKLDEEGLPDVDVPQNEEVEG